MISSVSQTKSTALAIPPILALFCIGGVSELAAVFTALITLIIAFFVIKGAERTPSKPLLFVSATLMFTAGAVCIPIPLSLHQLIQPKTSLLTLQVLEITGGEWQPLALRPRDALIGFSLLGSFLLYGWACCIHFTRASRLETSVKTLIGAIGLFCLIGILQRATGANSIYWLTDIPSFSREPFFGSLVNPNHAGAFLAAALPLSLTLGIRWSISLAPLLLIGIIMTGSRGGAIACAISAGLFFLITQKGALKWGLVGISLTIMLGALSMNLSQFETQSDALGEWTSHRFAIWKDASNLIDFAPLFGIGADGFADAFATVKSSMTYNRTHHAHQETLELLIARGWLGAVAVFILLLVVLQQGIQSIRKAENDRRKRWRAACFSGFIGMLIAAQFGFPLKLPANFLIFIFLGAGMIGPQLSHRKISILWHGGFSIGVLAGLIAIAITNNQSDSPFAPTAKWFEQGESNRRQRQNELALANYKSTLKTAPLYARALRQHALTQRHTNMELAITQAELASKMSPGISTSWTALAELYAIDGQINKSWSAWRKALAHDLPNNDKGDPKIKAALKTGNNPSEAALYALPERLDRRRRAALILHDMGHSESAQTVLTSSIESDPISRKISAILKLRNGDHKGAWEQIQHVSKSDCETARVGAKALLGMALKQEISGLQAMKQTRLAIDLCGREESLSKSLILSRLIEGSSDALIEGELMVRRRPQNAILRRWVIKTALKNKLLAKAQMHLEELQRRNQATEKEKRTLFLIKTNADADYLRELE